ncbi:hypothetical protein LguiA_022211 [Lonicera macranthoides]
MVVGESGEALVVVHFASIGGEFFNGGPISMNKRREPKKLEKLLRQQGLKGNSYTFLFGDFKKISMMIKEAKSKPINLSGDIVPRVMPWILDSINNYGNNCFLWFGTTPIVTIMDPELIKEVLHKHDIFRKPYANPLVMMLAIGLAAHEGEKWAKHRKIISPAFNLDKLKLMLPAIFLSCNELMSKWETIVSTKGSCELDVWPYLETLTSDIISRTAFGSSYEEGRKISQLQKEQAELVMQAAASIYLPGLRYKYYLKSSIYKFNFFLLGIIDFKNLKRRSQ